MQLAQDEFTQFQQIANEIGGEVYEGYQGRFMSGKCLGITVDSLYYSLFDLGRAAESRQVEFIGDLEDLRVDNLGRSHIIYFPSIEGVEDMG